MSGKGSLTSKAVRLVSPALEKYSEDTLLKDVWKRPDLSPRDRSIVTVAALIARNQAIEMPTHFTFALDNGVKPNEISEIITHSGVLFGLGECDVGKRRRNRNFRQPWNHAGSTSTGFW